jgi:hypothetical protein
MQVPANHKGAKKKIAALEAITSPSVTPLPGPIHSQWLKLGIPKWLGTPRVSTDSISRAPEHSIS